MMIKSNFWWQQSKYNNILPFDYPSNRVKNAQAMLKREGAKFKKHVISLSRGCSSFEEMTKNISIFVQNSLIHNPIYQPSKSNMFYSLLRRTNLKLDKIALSRIFIKLFSQRLIIDPEILFLLGEARCGQSALVLCSALSKVGIKSNPLQLPGHIVNEVFFDNTSYIVDTDAFKNGIFLENNGHLLKTKDFLKNPYIVDRFKPTGWMFRRNSRYSCNLLTNKKYSGYIDLYNPELDGQFSSKYGAPQTLYPPATPSWQTLNKDITMQVGEKLTLEFKCEYSERSVGYTIKCGTKSKGYSYDDLVLENLANETSNDIFEYETKETLVPVKFNHPGIYYLTVSAKPHYLREFPSYVWWSDELKIKVQ